MPARIVLALATISTALVITGGAAAAVDPAEYESAVAGVLAVDESISIPANSSSEDFVLGVSHNVDATLTLSAQSGPNGENPEGSGIAVSPSTRIHFDVTCLHVAGSLAAVGVVVTRSNFLPVGTEFIVFVRDTTLPGGMGDGHNTIGLPAESCEDMALVAATVPPHDAGNWAVNDAVLVP